MYNCAADCCGTHGLQVTGGNSPFEYGGKKSYVDIRECSFDRNSGHGALVSGGAETRLEQCKCWKNKLNGFVSANSLLKLKECEYTGSKRAYEYRGSGALMWRACKPSPKDGIAPELAPEFTDTATGEKMNFFPMLARCAKTGQTSNSWVMICYPESLVQFNEDAGEIEL